MDFTTIFNQLTANQQCLIVHTMVEMEHCTPIDEIPIANGIDYGRIMKGISQDEMFRQVLPIYYKKKGYEIGNKARNIESDMKLVENDMKSIMDDVKSVGNLKELIENHKKLRKEYMESIEDDLKLIESTYKSIKKRTSINSDLYEIILEFLEIDEDFITTAYFSSLSATDLFSSLSPRNKSAILYLMKNFETDYSLADDTKPIGVTPMDI